MGFRLGLFFFLRCPTFLGIPKALKVIFPCGHDIAVKLTGAVAGVIVSVIMEVTVDLINVPIFLYAVCAYII